MGHRSRSVHIRDEIFCLHKGSVESSMPCYAACSVRYCLPSPVLPKSISVQQIVGPKNITHSQKGRYASVTPGQQRDTLARRMQSFGSCHTCAGGSIISLCTRAKQQSGRHGSTREWQQRINQQESMHLWCQLPDSLNVCGTNNIRLQPCHTYLATSPLAGLWLSKRFFIPCCSKAAGRRSNSPWTPR